MGKLHNNYKFILSLAKGHCAVARLIIIYFLLNTCEIRTEVLLD